MPNSTYLHAWNMSTHEHVPVSRQKPCPWRRSIKLPQSPGSKSWLGRTISDTIWIYCCKIVLNKSCSLVTLLYDINLSVEAHISRVLYNNNLNILTVQKNKLKDTIFTTLNWMKWINIVNISYKTIHLFYSETYIRINLFSLQYISIAKSIKIHSEKKVVSATRNLRTNSASTMYYKVVITIMNK